VRVFRFAAVQAFAVSVILAASVAGLGLARAAGRAPGRAVLVAASSRSEAQRHVEAAGQPAPVAPARFRAACPDARAGYVRCFALYRPQYAANQAGAGGEAGRALRPSGLSPQAIESAYRLPVRRQPGQTVAVSIAFDTPDLAQYLASYRAHYHLPVCSAGTSCLRIVNQDGKTAPLPPSGVGSGWDLEATLDVSMISAACPHCRIVVVEANSPAIADMAATEDTAARLGARVISNSYGTREDGAALAYASAYHHRGRAIVVSSGDLGYTAANFPADLSTVTSVGGTLLTAARNERGWAEVTWDVPAILAASGSGCSAYVAKPDWQHDPHCPGRSVADVSAVAWNVPVYNRDYGGWVTVGGTSVAAPLIAGIYGLAGNAATVTPGYAYAHRRDLFDITRGSNSLFVTPAQACGGDYLCVAKKGYDAPTGLGTPDGIGAF
jgi:Subtilase family